MRKILVQASITVLTFTIGFSSVWTIRALTMSSVHIDPVSLDEAKSDLPEPERHRFLPTYRACKPGYTQGYETEDGQQLREGIALAADSDFGLGYRQRIRNARTPRVFVAKYRDHRGRVGERFILENEPNDRGEESVTILFYDGGDHYRFIDAPTRDLALEFEQYLINIDFKSPV